MVKFEKVQEKMKYLAFGKTKPETKRAAAKGDKLEVSESSKAKELLAKQSKRVETEILKVKALKQGRTGSVFKMRGIVEGKKKAKQDAHAVIDKETGEMVVSNEEIKRVTLSYCLNVLKNNEPDKEFEELVQLKEQAHSLRMECKGEDTEISEEEFFSVL